MTYNTTNVISTKQSNTSKPNQDDNVLIGSQVQPPITLTEYKKKYPCATKYWNTDNECIPPT